MTQMTVCKFRHVPVVEQERIVGIVSIGDVVKHALMEMRHESEALHDYIHTRGVRSLSERTKSSILFATELFWSPFVCDLQQSRDFFYGKPRWTHRRDGGRRA